MRHPNPALSIVCFSLIALGLAGCAPEEAASSFTSGRLRSGCGTAGGPAIDLVLATTDVTCDAATTELPATRLSVFAFGEIDALEAVEIERAYLAERCTDGACSAIVDGKLETLRTDGDRRELRWSLELADGTLDEGTAWVRVCAGPSGCI